MKGYWSDHEVQSLFCQVEKNKQENKSIKEAFNLHAKMFSRKPNSVRNYYYKEIDNLKNDKSRAQKLGISLEKHSKNQINYFSNEERDLIVSKIKQKMQEGCSVRKACLLLSNGDVRQMLRLQNKFRSQHKSPPSNVLEFPSRPKNITDSDITGLFMGLVKLVKKNALEEAKRETQNELLAHEASLRKAIVDLGQSQRELNFFKTQNKRLKAEVSDLKKRLLLTNCFKAKTLTQNASKKA